MALKDTLKTHRTWEDGVGLLVGVTIGLSPWLCEQTSVRSVVMNAALFGLAIIMLAQFQLVRLHRWEEVCELACGFWVAISPFVFGYAKGGQLRLWHWILGAIVVLIAVLELWQDWGKSDDELKGKDG